MPQIPFYPMNFEGPGGRDAVEGVATTFKERTWKYSVSDGWLTAAILCLPEDQVYALLLDDSAMRTQALQLIHTELRVYDRKHNLVLITEHLGQGGAGRTTMATMRLISMDLSPHLLTGSSSKR